MHFVSIQRTLVTFHLSGLGDLWLRGYEIMFHSFDLFLLVRADVLTTLFSLEGERPCAKTREKKKWQHAKVKVKKNFLTCDLRIRRSAEALSSVLDSS